MKLNLIITFLVSILVMTPLIGQEMTDDFFRSTGKINTVLAVVVILFVVLLIFLVSLDSRLRKLEKQKRDE